MDNSLMYYTIRNNSLINAKLLNYKNMPKENKNLSEHLNPIIKKIKPKLISIRNGALITPIIQDILDIIQSEREEAIREVIEDLEEIEIDGGDGRDIEEMAKQFGVPDSVMANRLFSIKKEELIKKYAKN